MEFITFPCICLVLVTFVLYYARKDIQWQKIILLISSTFFIAYYHILFIIAAIGISLFTFYAGKCIVKYKDSPKASWLLTLFIGVLASVWLAFRYWSPIFPLGISFYTFQALSYLIEVYWDDGEAEANVLDFVLYMLLFMKFLSGPIERGYDLLPQLKQVHKFNYKGITEGVRFTAIGIFMKIVIADRLAPHLDNIFSAVHNASGIQLLESTLLYPLQLYSDLFFIHNEIRFYKTGDICSVDKDGDILYYGRKDSQVKIQGFRIELSEIECVAKRFFSEQCAVVALPIYDDRHNCTIQLVVEKDGIEKENQLEDYLKKYLPSYMIPSKTHYLSHFPLNVNNKIDRRKINTIISK